MKAYELITKAESLVDEKYANYIWYGWIEDVLRDLTPAAKLLNVADIAVTFTDDAVSIDVGDIDNLYDIVSVSFQQTGKRFMQLRRLNVADGVSAGWVRDDDSITVQNLGYTAGTVRIKYYERLKLTEDSGEYTYNMPEGYDEVLLRGVCAFAMQKEEEIDRKSDFYGEYMLGKRRMLLERTFAMEPWNMQAVAQMMGGEG